MLREHPGEARRLAVTFEEQARAQAAERRRLKRQMERAGARRDGYVTDEVVGGDDEMEWNPFED